MAKEAKEEKIKYTKFEIARMIGSRALQISQGAPFLIKLSEKELEEIKYDPIKIAQKELDEGVIPITVRRPLPKAKADKDAKDAKEAKERKESK
jgi:DNA-directed RNA polymerase subunit K/omega